MCYFVLGQSRGYFPSVLHSLTPVGRDYNFMGNIFAQFPVSHKFSFTFCVGVILFFSLFLVFYCYSIVPEEKNRQVFLFIDSVFVFWLLLLFYFLFVFYITVYSERDEALSRL